MVSLFYNDKKSEKKKKNRVDLKMIMAPVSIDFSNNSLELSRLPSTTSILMVFSTETRLFITCNYVPPFLPYTKP